MEQLYYLDYALDVGIQSRVRWLCKSARFLHYTCESAAQWLLVAFTLHQLLAITWPHRSRATLTVGRVTFGILSARAIHKLH